MMRQIKRLFSRSSRGLTTGVIILLALLIIAITAAEYIKLPSFIPSWQEIFSFFGMSDEVEGMPTSDEGFELHVIDVGKADSLLVKCSGQAMLIDGGDVGGGEEILDYLKKVGVNELKYVMVTHPHADHIGGMHTILDGIRVDTIIMGDIPKKLVPTSKSYEKMLDSIENNNISVMQGRAGITFKLGEAKAIILSPADGFEDDELNNYSLVTRFEYGRNSFMLMGDAESEAEKIMQESGVLSRCDVIKIGHHGSDSSSKKKLLRALAPKYAIISVGEENTYGHPDPKVLKRLKELEIEYFRTDKNGTVAAYSDGKTVTIKTEK